MIFNEWSGAMSISSVHGKAQGLVNPLCLFRSRIHRAAGTIPHSRTPALAKNPPNTSDEANGEEEKEKHARLRSFQLNGVGAVWQIWLASKAFQPGLFMNDGRSVLRGRRGYTRFGHAVRLDRERQTWLRWESYTRIRILLR